MNPDIITSALPPPAPRSIRSARAAAAAPGPQPAQPELAREPGDARPASAGLGRAFRAPGDALRELARSTLESVTRTLILSVASVSRQRALGAFVERAAAAEAAQQQAAAVAAAAHVLRVRALLSVAEQRRFDELLREPSLEPLLSLIVGRAEAEALELVRGRLGAVEPSVTIASLARLIGSLRAGLTNEEYDRVIMRLPHLSLEEQRSLAAHLGTMTPVDAAMLLRGYLVPARA